MKQVVDRLAYLDDKVFNFNDVQLLKVEGKEIDYRNRQKTVVAARDLRVGEVIDDSSIDFKMIDRLNGEVDGAFFIGKTVKESIAQYDVITKVQVN